MIITQELINNSITIVDRAYVFWNDRKYFSRKNVYINYCINKIGNYDGSSILDTISINIPFLITSCETEEELRLAIVMTFLHEMLHFNQNMVRSSCRDYSTNNEYTIEGSVYLATRGYLEIYSEDIQTVFSIDSTTMKKYYDLLSYIIEQNGYIKSKYEVVDTNNITIDLLSTLYMNINANDILNAYVYMPNVYLITELNDNTNRSRRMFTLKKDNKPMNVSDLEVYLYSLNHLSCKVNEIGYMTQYSPNSITFYYKATIKSVDLLSFI